jgi:hypothetical protein
MLNRLAAIAVVSAFFINFIHADDANRSSFKTPSDAQRKWADQAQKRLRTTAWSDIASRKVGYRQQPFCLETNANGQRFLRTEPPVVSLDFQFAYNKSLPTLAFEQQYQNELIRFIAIQTCQCPFWDPYLNRMDCVVVEQLATWAANRSDEAKVWASERESAIQYQKIYNEALKDLASRLGAKIIPSASAPARAEFHPKSFRTTSGNGVVRLMGRTDYILYTTLGLNVLWEPFASGSKPGTGFNGVYVYQTHNGDGQWSQPSEKRIETNDDVIFP